MYRLAFYLLFLLTLTNIAAGQLCTGSLGDPIVNITFGAGGNPGTPLAAATTSYSFLPADCPNDGQYTIRNNTTSCFGNTWHALTADHTGNSGGYFMLVNASFQPGDFYLDTVHNLCANTTYEFAAWVVNVIKPTSCNNNTIAPNITFTIERLNGTVLRSFNSGNIMPTASPVWKNYGAFFTTPAGVNSVVVRMRNDAPGGCGNDLALDDITFRPCGPTVTPSFTSTTGKTLTVCQGNDTTIQLSSSVSAGYANPRFQWQVNDNGMRWRDIPGANATTLQVNVLRTTVTTYQYRMTVSEQSNAGIAACTIASESLNIIVSPLPIAIVSSNSPLCPGDTLALSATGGATYLWNGPVNFVSTSASVTLPKLQPVQAGKYTVRVTNAAGCFTIDSTTVLLNASPVAAVAFADSAVCRGNTIRLIAGGGNEYSWSPVRGLSNSRIANPLMVADDTSRYTVTVTNSFGCTDSAAVLVNVLPSPVADAGPDVVTTDKDPVLLKGSATGNIIQVSWSPANYVSSPTKLQTLVNPPNDTRFTLTVTSANGCGAASDTVHVKVYKRIDIPNAFSPNGDGINDTWKIPALAAYYYHRVQIFDRYGRLLYNTKNFSEWNGTINGRPLPASTYYYLIEGPEFQRLSGSVVIIR